MEVCLRWQVRIVQVYCFYRPFLGKRFQEVHFETFFKVRALRSGKNLRPIVFCPHHTN